MEEKNTAYPLEEKLAQELSERERRRRTVNPCLTREPKVVATISNWDLGKTPEPGKNPSLLGTPQVRASFSRLK